LDEVFAGMKPKEIEETIELTFNNTFKDLENLCQVIKEDQTKPELEYTMRAPLQFGPPVK